jgi:hypothetical protein
MLRFFRRATAERKRVSVPRISHCHFAKEDIMNDISPQTSLAVEAQRRTKAPSDSLGRGAIGSLLSIVLLSLAFGVAVTGHADAGPAHAPIEVGTRCQQEYQNNWQVNVGNNDVWNRCGNFNTQISRTENLEFYYNLHGAKSVLETTNDGCGWGCGSADSVDFLYMNTHGNANGTAAFWAMWDQGSTAFSSNMRLGDNSRELMVLATFACNVLQTFDGGAAVWNRWYNAFAGGLVMTVGGHGSLYSGNDQSATEFASRMQDGEPIGRAWLESTWYADNSNTPSAMATGANANDCWDRMGVTIPSLFPTPILRDSRIGYMCWSSWN